MRIALISDIHGNAIALKAVLAEIEQHSVDRIVCLGDVATIGPQPRETLDMLRPLGAAFVLGNHDAALLDLSLSHDYYKIAPILDTSLDWCEGQLTDEDREFLRTFRPRLEIPLNGAESMLCFHGSPKSNTDILIATTPPEELDHYFEGYPHQVMAGGHTHVQMLRQHYGTWFVNPGSVGNAFCYTPVRGSEPVLLPWAEYALLTADERGLSVDLHRVRYDIESFQAVVRMCELPIRGWLLEQYSRASANGLCGRGS
jgi:putative phosphoesterase